MSNEYLVQRRIKQHKLRRKARRGEIAVRRTYKLIRFIFILFMFYLLYRLSIVHYWYLPQNTYNQPLGQRIEIVGNNIVSNEKIMNEVKKFPLKKVPIYKINPAGIAHQLEQLSPIKRAYVRRFWFPARLVIMIEELTPAITISPSENAPDIAAYALTGEFMGSEFLPFKTTNAVRVLTYGTNGDDYENWDVAKIKNLYKLAKTIEQYANEKVMYIDLRTPHSAFVQLQSVKLKVGELDVSVYERIKSIHDILPAIKNLKLKTKYVDLSWKETKYIKEDVEQKD
jgi:cell division septal protein FtsQ